MGNLTFHEIVRYDKYKNPVLISLSLTRRKRLRCTWWEKVRVRENFP
ncbi:MAG: hypothetical protein IMF10_03090 [Proteobacteria bacterium]|nr:hypothetical protein [Pseudomonadota bacterium]